MLGIGPVGEMTDRSRRACRTGSTVDTRCHQRSLPRHRYADRKIAACRLALAQCVSNTVCPAANWSLRDVRPTVFVDYFSLFERKGP